MDRGVLLAIMIAFGVVLLALMLRGWLLRKRRQSDVAAPAPTPTRFGPPVAQQAGQYVATTTAGDPLDRIAVHGLGFRGPVTVFVTLDGILLRLSERDVWIPRGDLVGASRATWTIDRVVERDGLSTVQWRLGDRTVETALRMSDPRAFEVALNELLTEGTGR